MHKLMGCLLSFFIFGVISVKLNPKSHKKVSRSIASVNFSDPIVQNFKKTFQKQNISQERISQYILQNKLDKVHVRGNLNAIISEYDYKKAPITQYFIIDGDEKIILDLPSPPDSQLLGKEVSFEGFSHEDKLYGIVSPLNNPRLKTNQQYPQTRIQIEKMLVLFFKFNSSPKTYMTMQEAQSHLNLGYKTIFNNMSDHRLQHQISVSGWHHLPRDENAQQADGFGQCRVTNDEIKDAILSAGLDVTDYDNISIISNCSSYGTIGGHAILSKYDWLGVGKKSTYVRMASNPSILEITPSDYVPGWSSFTGILVHERGHNFGLHHSNGLDCGSNPFLQNCTHLEYGNRFDRMGYPDSTYTFNADNQKRAGWKNETKEFHHIKQSGTYYIDRLTESNPNRKIGAYLYLPGTNQKTMMLEYRQADKEDNRLAMWLFRDVDKGIHLYSAMSPSRPDESPSIQNTFRYIDSKPTSLDWHNDTAYESMNTNYYDPITGATIYMEGVVGTKAKVRVEFREQDQMCFRTALDKKVKQAFITRYSEIGVLSAKPSFLKMQHTPTRAKFRNKTKIKKEHIVLIPGDHFIVQLESAIGDNILCPRSTIKGEWINADQFYTWALPKPPKPDQPNNPSGEPGGSVAGRSQRTTPILHIFDKDYSYENYNKEHSPYPEMKVPQGYLNTDHEFKFTYMDEESGDTIEKTLYLHIRSKHNTPIYVKGKTNHAKF